MKPYQRHIFFWILYFGICYSEDIIIYPQAGLFSELLFYFTHTLYLFYSNLQIFKIVARCRRNKLPLGIFLFISNVSVFFIIRYIVRFVVIPAFNIPEDASTDLKVHFAVGVTWVVNFTVYALGYYYFQASIQKQKALAKSQEEKAIKEQERRLAVEQQLQTEQALNSKEQERLQLENIALRAQINPHFLFNTLGFLYSKALPHSEELSDGIMRLSEIMQFSVKPIDDTGLVSLNDEVEHIENVLEINKLRFNKLIYVDFTHEGDFSDIKIAPLVLLTLAENVLKHGQLNKPDNPASIQLRLHADRLSFITHNKIRIGPKEHSTSIGLNNTRKRLANTYGQNFSLTTKEEGDYFTTILIVANIRQIV